MNWAWCLNSAPSSQQPPTQAVNLLVSWELQFPAPQSPSVWKVESVKISGVDYSFNNISKFCLVLLPLDHTTSMCQIMFPSLHTTVVSFILTPPLPAPQFLILSVQSLWKLTGDFKWFYIAGLHSLHLVFLPLKYASPKLFINLQLSVEENQIAHCFSHFLYFALCSPLVVVSIISSPSVLWKIQRLDPDYPSFYSLFVGVG